jgi:transcriptional regulator with XRE-family HTH domain
VPIDFNQRVGANLQLHRKAKGYSQSDLAGLLEQRGLPFQQQTILKIEKGSRPLRLEEASVIADTLGIELSSLTEQFTNEAIATAATEILQRAAVIAKVKKGIEESRAKQRQHEDDMLSGFCRRPDRCVRWSSSSPTRAPLRMAAAGGAGATRTAATHT